MGATRRPGAGRRTAGGSWLALYINCGRRADSDRAADRAVEILEPLGPGPELAWAYAEQCGLKMCAQDPAALTWGEKALALAEEYGPPRAMARALQCHRHVHGQHWRSARRRDDPSRR